jgi:O-methyltransferase involved in polyketide biosynthesis
MDGVPNPERVRPELAAVPETLLWSLHHRALEARRPGGVLRDPMAVELVERLDFPFEERFGARAWQGQAQALRVRAFDREVVRFALRHPGGTVVALGEGLETQRWRVDDGRLRWTGVDLPDVVALRQRLLPPDGERRRTVACSVLDPAWLDQVPERGPVLLTAQGLLMYLQPREVHELVARIAARWPHASLVFDTVPRWWSRRTLQGVSTAEGYTSPPMPWGVDAAAWEALAAVPGVAEVRSVAPPRGRGVLFGAVLPLAWRWPALERALPFPSPAVARFGP